MKKTQNHQKNSLIEPPTATKRRVLMVLFIFISLLLLVGTVSAFELNPFADIKNYEERITDDMPQFIKDNFNSKYGVIRLSNTFFWIETSKIAEYSLIENTAQCITDCSAEGKAVLYSDGKLFDGVNFIGAGEIERQLSNVQYWLKTYEEYEDVEKSYIDIEGNLTTPSEKIVKIREVLTEYNFETLKAGNYEWVLTGEKSAYDNVDFRLIKGNKEFTEWAWWNGTGGTRTISGLYTIHTFTSNGSFNWSGDNINAEVLVIGGGGSGGRGSAGGGGAGGYQYNNSYPLTEQNYTVTIGAGGLSQPTHTTNGYQGYNSVFGTITGEGGGYGGSYDSKVGGNGGSGGGGGAGSVTGAIGGTGSQGYGGGTGESAGAIDGGGGGGAGEVGHSANTGSHGGDGLQNDINGTNIYYAGGGGGSSAIDGSSGGLGGGGASAVGGTAGTNGLGGGGGAASNNPSGAGGSGVVIIRYLTYGLTITLNAPPIMANLTTSTFGLNGTANGDIVNVSLILNAIYNGTNTSGTDNALYNFDRTLADGFYNWTMEVCDAVSCLNATTWNFTIDTTPQINVFSPTNTTYATPTIYFNATNSTATDKWIVNYNGTNITLSDINTTLTVENGNHHLLLYANASTTGKFGLNDTIYFTKEDFINNGVTYNATTLETDDETFYLNITGSGSAITTAQLDYNGTNYSATITNIAGDVYNISRTIDVPITTGNKTFRFHFQVGGILQTTTNYNQTVNLTNFTHFSSGTPFINISFKNETLSEELVNATINSNWYYWLGGGAVVKTHSFTNASENAYYPFLLVGINRTLHTNTTITYTNSISQQRIYTDLDLDLTNTTTELRLYLLPTTEGVYVTFQVISIAEQPIGGVFSNVTKAGALISSGTTDDSGAISYFLDPDTSYTFTFSKDEYITYTTTLTPTQTTFTITLSQTAVAPEEDYTRGISYSFSPGIETLTNGTLTFFNFSLTSSYWDVSSFGFNLTNQDGTIVDTTSATTSGGSVYVYHNTSNDTSLTMTYYWIVSGNTTSGSFTWVVFDGTGAGFGVTTFFNRITTYLGEGIFGITTNSMVILIYLIIFISVGIMSLKFGIRSPATIMMVLFGLGFLFEVHLELIPLVGGVPMLTTTIGIIVAIALIREYLKI